MQNFNLLKAVCQTNKSVILKRGMCATVSEWLMTAEYIAASGKAWMVPALARAAIAAGADGLLIEMNPTPSEAWCAADQALAPEALNAHTGELRGLAAVLGCGL